MVTSVWMVKLNMSIYISFVNSFCVLQTKVKVFCK